MRHRQRGGLVVLGLAVVLVAVITSLHPHLVAGAAEVAPVPGPPVVGDCVLDALQGPPQRVAAPVTATSGGTVPVYPAQQIRSCTASRYGEVAAVIGVPKPTVVKGDANDRHLEDPNGNSCYSAVVQYLGLSEKPILGFWEPAVQYIVALSRPSSRQEAAGQHWAACIVTIRPPDTQSPPTPQNPAAPQYGSSIRDALYTGEQRDHLGMCIPVLDWNGDINTDACQRPHALEVMAIGDSGDHPVTRTQLELTCQQLVRRQTAMVDPTAAGALAIQTYVWGMSSVPVTTAQVPAHSSIDCGVSTTGARKLRGSLLALGQNRIPWA